MGTSALNVPHRRKWGFRCYLTDKREAFPSLSIKLRRRYSYHTQWSYGKYFLQTICSNQKANSYGCTFRSTNLSYFPWNFNVTVFT
jgi:hypothetical protein